MKKAVFQILFCFSLLVFLPVSDANASLRFVPPFPDTILIEMYELNEYGVSNGLLCNSFSTSFGCTAFCDDLISSCVSTNNPIPYPYFSNPIYAPIETYYLLDVVSQEMNPSLYPEQIALHAQAIASRSYLGWVINNDSQILNNSASRQVFIPFKFDSLNLTTSPLEPSNSLPCSSSGLNGSQELVCQAVSSHYYIAREYNNPANLPAFSEFTADVFAQTQNHPELSRFPYLAGVVDPISTACDANNFGSNLAGLSQEGANRWVRGHECSRPYAPVIPGNDPGDTWSVRWNSVQQVLFHYYTDVHLRDASGNLLSASYRWNPLQITGIPVIPNSGSIYSIYLQIQNVGTEEFVCDFPYVSYSLKYRWNKTGHTEVISSTGMNLCGLGEGKAQGETLSLQVPSWGPGPYTLDFDVYAYTPYTSYSSFWFSDFNWPAYQLRLCVDEPCKVHFPMVAR